MKEEAMKRVSLMFVLVGVMVVLSAGVATAAVKYGSNGRDFFIGTNGEDTFYGKGSSDGLFGRGDDDVLDGDEGDDFMFGGSFRYGEIFDGRRMIPDGEDRLYGGSGDDCMFGGSEDDVIYGGTGNDEMGFYCYDFIFDTGEDVFYGGPGNEDIIAVEPGRKRDIVYCGSGRDRVLADNLDRLYGCERVERFGRR
jgi:hypothetical protein